MKLQRREFLHRAALGVGGLIVAGPRLDGAVATSPAFFDPWAPVPLGKSGLTVSRFCLGTGMTGGMRQSNHTRMGKAALERLIRESFDRGTRLFDLADLYGTHPYLVPALKGIPRDRYQIVSKVWWMKGGLPESERPDADVVIARFLKELGTDHIDLVLLHCVTSPRWPQELRRQMDLLSERREKGDIRALGVSCHSLAALEAAAAEPWVQSVHARINPYGMSMDGPAERVAPVLKRIHDAGKGVVGMKIVGEGRLRDDPERRQASVRYALTLGCVDVLNVGCETVAEVDDLAEKVRRVEQPA
ncbi:MAG: Oxidoreductase, aldo/keto reductase family [Acidobacteria bacterium]|nr:Oxidoreductase, aldo/keto reductase family [Acidobacteriota bacterium]